MAIQEPIKNAGRKYVDGLEMARVDDENISIAAGAARDSSNVNDIVLDAAINIDATIVGANGMDAGALGNNLLYAVYVIADSSKYRNAAGLLSLASNAAPSLPFGYDMYRRVGFVRTDGTADLLEFHQYGSDEKRIMWYDAPIQILAAGNETAFAVASEIDLSNIVPAARANMILDVDFTANAATNIAELTVFGSTSPMVRWGAGAAAQQRGQVKAPLALDAGVPKILYRVSNALDALTLLCAGYEDYLD